MKHQIKRFVFKLYAPISFAVFFAAIVLLLIGLLNWDKFAAIAAGVFAFAFGVQKQNLEETKLFKKLFEQFNERYGKLNDELNRICFDEQPTDKPFTVAERDTLYKYFNLCGEEYLYYDKGFICEEVWKDWKKGMDYFRRNARIKDFWDKELRDNDSYYGLQF